MFSILNKMNLLKYSIRLFFILIVLFKITFANTNIRFEHLTSSDGLSGGTVLSIYQDRRGFMWFGSMDGLNKYDGYTITIYRHDISDSNSISSNEIYAINEDNNGNLWLGTKNGLNKYLYAQNRFITYLPDSNKTKSMSSNTILTIYKDTMDNNNIFWLGTLNGLFKLDYKKNIFTQ
ncbi:MAG: hybrid sensor histidine kinase/response regulator, partial [Calditrichia bacterium]|nr:hybrid sensor histidine kinase/response regulator [Calditrichia bacterium]